MTTSEPSALGARIDALILGRIKTEGIMFQLGGESAEYGNLAQHTVGPFKATLDYRRVDEFHHDSLFLKYIQHPVLPQITQGYIWPDVSTFRSMSMNRLAHKGSQLLWHQDVGAGWEISTNPITVWTALDRVTVEAARMHIVLGSHKLGILNSRHYMSEADHTVYCVKPVYPTGSSTGQEITEDQQPNAYKQ